MRGFPGYTIAGPKTIVRSLASLLKQWNLEYPSNVCCILASRHVLYKATKKNIYITCCEMCIVLTMFSWDVCWNGPNIDVLTFAMDSMFLFAV